jgi:hypothetical protein
MQKDLKELRDRLGQATKAAIIDIIENNAKKTANWRADKSALEKGHWYHTDYAMALLHWKQEKRLNWLKETRPFEFGYATTNFFVRAECQQCKPCKLEFIAKPAISASEALAAAIESFGITDCGNICQLARYKAIETILGVDKFNRLFDAKRGAAINIGYQQDGPNQPMRLFVEFTAQREQAEAFLKNVDYPIEFGKIGNRPVKVGQLTLFHGATNYRLKHPHGEAQSWNVICVDATPGKQSFSGFGLNPQGETEMAIYQRMIKNYNDRPSHQLFMTDKDYRYVESERRRLGKFVAAEVTTHTVGGFDAGGVQDFILEHIDRLIDTPVEHIKPALIEHYPTPESLKNLENELSQGMQNGFSSK